MSREKDLPTDVRSDPIVVPPSHVFDIFSGLVGEWMHGSVIWLINLKWFNIFSFASSSLIVS